MIRFVLIFDFHFKFKFDLSFFRKLTYGQFMYILSIYIVDMKTSNVMFRDDHDGA